MNKRFLVLSEKQYVIAHYVPIIAEDATAARKLAICAVEDGDRFPQINESIGDAFAEIEAYIDGIAEEGDFILNGPSEPAKGVRIAEEKDWGRPLVIERKEETASSVA